MPRRGRAERHFGKRLYLRIWLALLAGLLLTALLAGGAWRLYGGVETPREISLTDAAGADAGRARLDFRANPGTVRIEMDDGRVLFARWRDYAGQRAWSGFAGWLLLIAAAVGLAAYPVVRRLTRRLESLQQGVDALGEGDLAARVPVRGHDEIAFLATRFNHAAARIEALVGAHKSMLANASHELRSPLTRIRMAVEMLDHGEGQIARAEIARNIVELDSLIEEILLLSRLQSNAVPDEPFGDIDLTALAAEECARAGLEFSATAVVVVSGSARLLRRALSNLIENARRHGGRQAAIDVSITQKASLVDVAVCDRGPGVPADQRERIFDAFYRLPGAAEAIDGTGLGLSLVRTIMRKHGGDARCDARDGGGACFHLTMPAPRTGTAAG